MSKGLDQIRTDAQTVCKGYQQTTKAAACKTGIVGGMLNILNITHQRNTTLQLYFDELVPQEVNSLVCMLLFCLIDRLVSYQNCYFSLDDLPLLNQSFTDVHAGMKNSSRYQIGTKIKICKDLIILICSPNIALNC